MGRPAVFLRLSGCLPPLCPWCDSRHSWEPGEKMRVDAVFEKILAHRCPLVVITGGEPLLQWDRGLDRLAGRLLGEGLALQYETSGKIPFPEGLSGLTVCSPKFLEGRWHLAAGNARRADAFKFVVEEGIDEILSLVEENRIPREKVWLMPMGATREAQLARTPDLWRLCADNGFNLSARLHVLAFDDKKGV